MQSKSTKHGATPEQLAGLAKARMVRASKSQHLWLAASIAKHNSDECLLWPFGKMENGYGFVKFKGKHYLVHRFSFFLTHGHWPSEQTRHTCDVRACFNPLHLLEGSREDNTQDALIRDRFEKGESRENSKLTDDKVKNIRDDCAYSTQRELATRYGVCQSVISQVVNRKRWRHVK